MVIMDRQGIHIDYCTQCHGIYLDRGELEKIVEFSVRGMSQVAPPAPMHPQQPVYQQPIPRPVYHDYDDDDYYRRHRKKKKGWLDDIFDFD